MIYFVDYTGFGGDISTTKMAIDFLEVSKIKLMKRKYRIIFKFCPSCSYVGIFY